MSPLSPLVPAEETKVAKAPTDREALHERKQMGTGLSTCDGCVHLLLYGTCGEPVAAGLVPEFGIVWPPDGHGAGCAAFSGLTSLMKKDRPSRLNRVHTVIWVDIEFDPWEADGTCAGHLDELQEF